MSAPAAIQAQLVDVRNVSSHKCVRLEIHVPAEQAGEIMAAFGWPTMAEPVPVALARLNPTISRSEIVQRERQPFTSLPYAKQAALRCNEPDFQKFIQERHSEHYGSGPFAANSDAAASAVRSLCGVNSRADIGTGPNDRSPNDSGFKWRSLDAEYYSWQRGRR